MGGCIGVHYVDNNEVAVVEKKWGSEHLRSGIISLNGENGYQPNVLRGGIHYLAPMKYSMHRRPLITIPQGKIGYIFARDGQPLPAGQNLASNVRAYDFEDATGFLRNGGQRGPQRRILREGTYAINLAMFVVITEDRIFSVEMGPIDASAINSMSELIRGRNGFRPVTLHDKDDFVGIVTVHDGPTLPQGAIIAPVVGDNRDEPHYHDSFQDADAFISSGGFKGRQFQVLTEGTYFINHLFATVECLPKTTIAVGSVGVVVSYTGPEGGDTSGAAFTHGTLVKKGQRGVWDEALLSGKYGFNTYAGTIIMVPTTNFILKWTRSESGDHKLDENLKEIALITKDAFEPSLPLSVVVHIDYRKAPLIVQRFGDVKQLVEQTLDPMVAAYFKNIGQTRTLIELIQDRTAIQLQATVEMREKFARYNLELEEVLIGTPAASHGDTKIPEILEQLRMRQIAMEQVKTFSRQEVAARTQQQLNDSTARAQEQEALTTSELNISIQQNKGKADLEQAIMDASSVRELAAAEQDKIMKIGVATALTIEERVRAFGGAELQATQAILHRFSDAVKASKTQLTPKVIINQSGGGNSNGGNAAPPTSAIEGMMSLFLAEKLVDSQKSDMFGRN